ncbi:RNA polymerase II-associated protein 3 [Bienertia sinuspersici]
MATQNDQMSQSLSKLSKLLESLNNRIPALEISNPNKVKDLETMVHRLTDPYSYHESPEFDLDSATQLPEKFSASDLPKFKPIDAPRFHLKGFRATMSIKDIDPILYPKIFPLSLDPICQEWFFSLDEKDTATWEDIAHSFMTNYKGLESFDKVYHIGIEIENDLLKESNKNNKDGVPSSCVNAIETNQQRPKRKRRQYTPLDKYCRYHQGNGHSTEKYFKLTDCIQDLVDKGNLHISFGDKKPNIQTNPLSVLLIDDEECSFDPTSYITPVGQPMPLIITPPDHNQINGIGDDKKKKSAQDGPMLRLLSKMVEVFEYFNLRMTILEQKVQDNLVDNKKMVQWITDQYKHHERNDTPRSFKGVSAVVINDVKITRRKRRKFTPLGMTYTQAFNRLKSKRVINPIGPTLDPPADRRSHNWDTNKYCKYQ